MSSSNRTDQDEIDEFIQKEQAISKKDNYSPLSSEEDDGFEE